MTEEGREPWQSSDLAIAPNIEEEQVQAKKQSDGSYKLFFRGTRNEVFPEVTFESASEARNFFKVQKQKAQEAQYAETGRTEDRGREDREEAPGATIPDEKRQAISRIIDKAEEPSQDFFQLLGEIEQEYQEAGFTEDERKAVNQALDDQLDVVDEQGTIDRQRFFADVEVNMPEQKEEQEASDAEKKTQQQIVQDQELELYEKGIGRIREMGGIQATDVQEQHGKEGVQELRRRFGPAIVRSEGEPMDVIAQNLAEESPELGIESGDKESLWSYLTDQAKSKREIKGEAPKPKRKKKSAEERFRVEEKEETEQEPEQKQKEPSKPTLEANTSGWIPSSLKTIEKKLFQDIESNLEQVEEDSLSPERKVFPKAQNSVERTLRQESLKQQQAPGHVGESPKITNPVKVNDAPKKGQQSISVDRGEYSLVYRPGSGKVHINPKDNFKEALKSYRKATEEPTPGPEAATTPTGLWGGNLEQSIQKLPNGKFRFAGDVDARLALEDAKTGGVPTEEQIKTYTQAQSRVIGKKQADVKTKTFESKQEAIEFARSLQEGGPIYSYQKVEEGAKKGGEPEKAEKPQLEDAGEKLGGARKDQVPSARQDLTDEDIASQPLSKIWPKSEIEAIEDPFLAATAQTLRDEIPAKPKKRFKLNQWVQKVQEVRRLMTYAADMNQDEFLQRLAERPSLEHLTTKIRLLQNLDRKHWSRIGDVKSYPDAYRYENGKPVPSPHSIVEIDKRRIVERESGDPVQALDEIKRTLEGEQETQQKKMQFEVRGQKGSYFINKKGDPEYRPLKWFNDRREALEYVKNNNDALVAAWEDVKARDNVGEKDIRAAENRPRRGKDHRQGRDVSSEEFANTFGFRGVEFGKWVKQGKAAKERQEMLNQAYDSLMDLADLLNLPPRAMSLEGTLGLGIGSRGRGWAAAHYEPNRLVINLTKTRGAGTLAHEWFHALDNYFQRKRGTGPTRESSYITYQPESHYKHQPTGFTVSETRFKEMSERGALRGRQEDWVKVEGVRPEVERVWADLVKTLDESPMAQRSRNIDKGKSDGYWSRVIERAARAFENYVIARMMQEGYHNDYLANVVSIGNFVRNNTRYPYLLEEEVAPIAEAFDNLFATIETRETEQGVALYSRKGKSQFQQAVEEHLPPAYQRAYHGTPYRGIEQTGFDISRIGSGEGAQAFGWGLYFAGKREIGEFYREQLSNKNANFQLNGKPIGQFMLINEIHKSLIKNKNIDTDYFPAIYENPEDSIQADRQRQKLENYADEIVGMITDGNYNDIEPMAQFKEENGDADEAHLIRKVKQFVDENVEFEATPGQLYEVEVPDESELLDWDALLSKQHPEVRKAMDKSSVKPRLEDTPRNEIANGKDWYKGIATRLGSEQEASKLLNSLGIKGHKYKDASARGTEAESYNYVIYDDQAIEILNTYYSFAGRTAETADQHSLIRAQRMLAQGEDTETVRQETGWFKGPDDKWRFEIADRDATINAEAFKKDGNVYITKLGDLMSHPKLYAAYPWLKDVDVATSFDRESKAAPMMNLITLDHIKSDRIQEYASGLHRQYLEGRLRSLQNRDVARAGRYAWENYPEEFNSLDEAIEEQRKFVNRDIERIKDELAKNDPGGIKDAAEKNMASTILHEIQHFIQSREGFSRGGSAQRQDYRWLAGEVEARNVERRMYRSEGALRAVPPELTADVSAENIVVEFDGIVAGSAPLPANAPMEQPAGISATNLRQSVDAVAKRWANKPVIHVVQSETELPAEIQRDMESKGAWGDVEGVFWGGEAYLVADNLSSVERAQWVLLHEAIGHNGLRGVMGQEARPILKQAYLNKDVRDRAQAISQDYGFDLRTESGRLQATEEALANMAAEGVDSTALDRVVAKVREWIRKVFPKLKMSDAEIRSLIGRSRAFVEGAGQAATPEVGQLAYSRRKKPDIIPEELMQAYREVQKQYRYNTRAKQESERVSGKSYPSDQEVQESVKWASMSESEIFRRLSRGGVKAVPKNFRYIPHKDFNRVASIGVPYWQARMEHGRAIKEQERAERGERAGPTDEAFNKIFQIFENRQEQRNALFNDLTEPAEEFWEASGQELNDLRDLIWVLDNTGNKNKQLKSIQKFRPLKDENGRRRYKNGKLLIEIHPGFYDNLDTWMKNQGISEGVRRKYLAARKTLDNALLTYYNWMLERGDWASSSDLQEYRRRINTDLKFYFPHKRRGNWYVQAKDSEGNVLYRQHFDIVTPGQGQVQQRMVERKARQIASKLQDQYPNASWDSGRVAKHPEEVFEDPIPLTAMQQILDSAANKIDANKQDQRKLQDALTEATSDILKGRGWSAHAIRRRDPPVEGYEMDDVQGVFLEYISGLAGSLTKMDASHQATGALREVVSARQPVKYAQATSYVRNQLRNQDEIDRWAQNIKSIAFVRYLGLNLHTATLNLTQNIIAGVPRLSLDAGKHAYRYYADALEYIAKGGVKGKEKGRFKDEEVQMLNELYHNGISSANYTQEVAGRVQRVGPKTIWTKFVNLNAWPMHVAESFNRSSIGLAAFRVARDGNITNKRVLKEFGYNRGDSWNYEDAKAFAERIVKDSHFVYGKENRPNFFTGSALGRAISPVYTFRTFTHNFLNLMRYMLFQGGRGWSAFGQSLLMTVAMGGLTSFPLYNTLTALFQSLFDDDWDLARDAARKWVPQLAGDYPDLLRDIVTYGTPSILGINIGGSIRIEMPGSFGAWKSETLKDTGLRFIKDLMGIPWDMFVELPSDAYEAWSMGEQQRALEKAPFIPAVVAHSLEAMREYREGKTTVSGRPISTIGKNQAKKPSALDAILTGVGYNTLQSTKEWDQSRLMSISRSIKMEKQQYLATRFTRAARNDNKDDLRRIIQEWQDWNKSALKDKEIWRVITAEQLERAIQARSEPRQPPKYMIQRFRELKNIYQ